MHPIAPEACEARFLRRRRCLRPAVLLLAAIAASAVAPGVPGSLSGPDTASALVSRVDSLPSPRTRTSAVWANGRAYVFGGRTGTPSQGYSSTKQIVEFTPGVGSTVVGQLPPTRQNAPFDGREDTAAIWDGSNAYIFGGYDSSGTPLSDIVRFNPETRQAEVVARLPLATGGATAAWDGESAYIFGGYVTVGGQERPQLSAQIVRFTPGPGGGTATTLNQALPSGRNHAGAVSNGVTITLFGGHNGRDALDEIVEFFPAGNEVSIVARLPSPRHDTSGIWLPGNPSPTGNFYVFGGAESSQDDNITDEIVAYDPLDDPTDGQPVEVVDRFPGGGAHVSAVASDAVGGYLFGGESGPGGRELTDQIARFTRPARYVALGDSYSSGEGLGEKHGPYLEGGDSDCHRHQLAYPALFSFNGPTELDLYACSGARTEHVYDPTVAQRPGEPPLPQSFRAELTDRTDLVTLTIGGNDVGEPKDEGYGGLSDALGHCYRNLDCQKDKKFVARIRTRITALGEKLRRTILAVKDRTGPDTAIFLLGYPRVFPTDTDPKQQARERTCDSLEGPGTKFDGWTPNEQTFLNAATDKLNALSSSASAAAGIRFIDVTERFIGHAICDEDEGGAWINALTETFQPPGTPPLKYGTGSFHPNLDGQIAYAAALRDYIFFVSDFIGRGILPGRLTPIGLPANPEQETFSPQTRITRRPRSPVRFGKTVSFRFTSTGPASTFSCRMDAEKSTPCRSPKSYKRLAPGKHVFTVRATSFGIADPSPAKARFQVRKRKRR